MTDLTMWTALVGFFVPVVVSVVQQPKWMPRTRALGAVLISGIAGLGTVYFTTPSLFDTGITATVMLTVAMAATAAYNTFSKPVGIRTLEDLTSPSDLTLVVEKAVDAELLAMSAVNQMAKTFTDDYEDPRNDAPNDGTPFA